MSDVRPPFHGEVAGQVRQRVAGAVDRTVVQNKKSIDALIQMVQNVSADDVRLVSRGADGPNFQTAHQRRSSSKCSFIPDTS
jgi:hypothetical protein